MPPPPTPFELGRARWPDLALDRTVFDGHVRSLGVDAADALEHAADLFLACACAHAVPGATAAFELAFGGVLAQAAAKVRRDPAFVADGAQATREQILVSRGDELPRIATYGGRAPLSSWVRVTTARVVGKLLRRASERPYEELSSGIAAVARATSPEVAAMQSQYAGPLGDAIRRSLARLSTRDRNLLRLHLADGMSIDRLAVMYGIGRSTAARWLAAARTALATATRDEFCACVGVTLEEFDSIAAALQSHLDVSLLAHLGA